MGLSDDQRAMLRLLAQREQGYEDIAALMGISVEQVRERVGEALAQLEAEGKEAPEVPDPLAKEESVAPPPPPAPTEEEPPATAEAAPPAESPPPPPPEQPSTGSKSKLPKDPAIRAAIAAGILVFALFGVILIINSSSGDSDSSRHAAMMSGQTTSGETTSSANPGDGESPAKEAEGKLTKAVLEPVDGSGATGVAIFGRVGKKLALQVEAEGLEPTSKGTSYTLWLAQSPQRMLPLAETAVPKSGRIAARFEVPVELIAYLASETFDQLVITRTEDAKLNAALAVATKKKATPTYTGDPVLAGTVTGPIVGIAKRAQSE